MRGPKIYRRVTFRRVALTVVKTLLILALALVILFVVLFFWLRRYAVYTDDGVHIVFDQPAQEQETPEKTE